MGLVQSSYMYIGTLHVPPFAVPWLFCSV